MAREPPGGPPQLPRLVVGQKIQNGPYTRTVTEEDVARRDRDNRELARRWEREERRIARMMEAQEDYAGDFKEFNVRRRFIRRVFAILTLQLIFTGLVVATFYFVEEARNFMIANPLVLTMAIITFMVAYFAISCSDCARRAPPCNVLTLFILTAALSYVTAAATIAYSAESVLITTGTTAFVTAFIFFTAACTKFDFTKYSGFLIIVSLVGTIGLLVMLFVMYYTQIQTIQVWFGIVGALIMSMYLFFDVQTMMGGKQIELNPDEVVFATTQLYVDVLTLYKYLLLILGNQQ